MNDIDKILKAIEYYETQIWQEKNIVAPWFQVLDLYTNNYPKDLLMVFLYLHLDKDIFNIELLLSFVKSLVRYCYSAGSTTNIKYYVYDLTVKVIEDKKVEKVEVKKETQAKKAVKKTTKSKTNTKK